MSNSIGVAGGSTKAEAILAALKGKYLDVLITDETTATNVLSAEESGIDVSL